MASGFGRKGDHNGTRPVHPLPGEAAAQTGTSTGPHDRLQPICKGAEEAPAMTQEPTEREVRDLANDKGLAFKRRNNMWRKRGAPFSVYNESGLHWAGYTFGDAARFLRSYQR
jgi:hypothetical protein